MRGGIYPGIRRNTFLTISVDSLNRSGTSIVVEVSDDAPTDVRGLLAVQLTADDPLPDSWVLCWRINYVASERLNVADGHGSVTDTHP